VSIDPHYSEAHNNLGAALAEQGGLEEAVLCYQEAIRLRPDNASAHYNLANARTSQGRIDDALASYAQALCIRPDYVEALHNQALAFASQRRFDDAHASYRQALRVRPDYADAHFCRAELLLLQGDFEQGWPEYEWRLRLAGVESRAFTAPRWDGGSLAGRTILLHTEQGLGDTIQFLRYAPLVQARGGTVLLECPPILLSLAQTCPGIDRWVAAGEPLPAFDVQASLLSLPGILQTTAHSIPAAVPYLTADPARVEHWRDI